MLKMNLAGYPLRHDQQQQAKSNSQWTELMDRNWPITMIYAPSSLQPMASQQSWPIRSHEPDLQYSFDEQLFK